MDEARCRTLISVYDLDRSGVLETEEFVTWMMLEHVRVSIKDSACMHAIKRRDKAPARLFCVV